ncbi:FIST signal transduction protein [Thermithiobacillus plumbiphilus]|uniref:FIST N-terminal domain-containing protein n=1 Tax=Thermithiobacillus plumbiphilus TaxID=1729899 RepID=A0ABU9D4A9_9PROT
MSHDFRYGHGSASQWRSAAQSCLAQLGELPVGTNLGFLFVSDAFTEHLDDILAFFQGRIPGAHWVGTLGIGICSTGQEYLDRPAIAVMVGSFAPDSFEVFPAIADLGDIASGIAVPRPQRRAPNFAIVHGDPYTPDLPELIEAFASQMSSGFVTGGLTSSRSRSLQIADAVTQGGLSGVVFSPGVCVSTRLTQSVSPIGPRHIITECHQNVIISIDNRPALDVFYEEIGELLVRDLQRAAGYIFVGLPVPGSDTNDYLVRNLTGVDIGQKLLAIGELLEPGQPLLFCRRDGSTAREDMLRMLSDLKENLQGARPQGGLYYSCLGRGESLFGPDSAELRMIQEILGDFPLVGFFANGEISHDRLYGYTGVLTLFT